MPQTIIQAMPRMPLPATVSYSSPRRNSRPTAANTALTLPPVADEAASVSGMDGETLRQAVKWSVILEKKF